MAISVPLLHLADEAVARVEDPAYIGCIAASVVRGVPQDLRREALACRGSADSTFRNCNTSCRSARSRQSGQVMACFQMVV